MTDAITIDRYRSGVCHVVSIVYRYQRFEVLARNELRPVARWLCLGRTAPTR